MKKIATIIVTYNALRNEWLYKCLDSVLNSSVKSDIIVIDNNSSDETVSVIKKNYPAVNLFEEKENLGFGKANNKGLETALRNGNDFFFLLNQDSWIESDTLEKLSEKLVESPEFGILSPLHLTGKGDKLDWNFDMSASYKFSPGLCSDFILGKKTDKVYKTDFVCAAAWMISKDCLEKVGGFNPTFYHYAEDDNFIHRMHHKGLSAGIYPKVKMYHDRENRPHDDNFWNENYISKNTYLKNISNPNHKITSESVISHLKISYYKALLGTDFNKAKKLKTEINFFKENGKQFDKNLEISMNEKFAFLNFKEK